MAKIYHRTAGNKLTPAEYEASNSHVDINGNILDVPTGAFDSCAEAHLNADQAIPNATKTLCNIDVKDIDTLNEFNTATHRFTAAAAGTYLIIAQVAWYDESVLYSSYTFVYINGLGGTYLAASGEYSASACKYAIIAHLAELAQNDYVEVYAYQSSGASRNITGNNGRFHTYLSVKRVK